MNIIDNYRFGKIVINNQKYNKDLIVFSDYIQTGWWRKEGHSLCLDDLSIIEEKKPKILIVGTGSSGIMKVPENVIKSLNEQEIDVIVSKTPEAVQEYNKLVKEGKNVAGAFHLTC
jgi:hypothetical protein